LRFHIKKPLKQWHFGSLSFSRSHKITRNTAHLATFHQWSSISFLEAKNNGGGRLYDNTGIGLTLTHDEGKTIPFTTTI